MTINDNSRGWWVEVGSGALVLPAGWLYTPSPGVILCGNHELRQQITLVIYPNPESPQSIPLEGERTPLTAGIFSGHREEGEIKPNPLERFLFGRKRHYRFEWILQNDTCGLAAVYLAELNENRQHIRNRVEALLSAIEPVAEHDGAVNDLPASPPDHH
jgi:hypothetical protein